MKNKETIIQECFQHKTCQNEQHEQSTRKHAAILRAHVRTDTHTTTHTHYHTHTNQPTNTHTPTHTHSLSPSHTHVHTHTHTHTRAHTHTTHHQQERQASQRLQASLFSSCWTQSLCCRDYASFPVVGGLGAPLPSPGDHTRELRPTAKHWCLESIQEIHACETVICLQCSSDLHESCLTTEHPENRAPRKQSTLTTEHPDDWAPW